MHPSLQNDQPFSFKHSRRSSHLRKFLELLNQSSVAYTTETAGSFQEAYQLHQSAISELERLGESLSFLSFH
jgi:hypothetical protein